MPVRFFYGQERSSPMPLQLDSRAIKAEARSLLHTGEVNPFKLTLFYLLISLVLDTVNAGVSYTIESAGGFTVLSFSFVSISPGVTLHPLSSRATDSQRFDSAQGSSGCMVSGRPFRFSQ